MSASAWIYLQIICSADSIVETGLSGRSSSESKASCTESLVTGSNPSFLLSEGKKPQPLHSASIYFPVSSSPAFLLPHWWLKPFSKHSLPSRAAPLFAPPGLKEPQCWSCAAPCPSLSGASPRTQRYWMCLVETGAKEAAQYRLREGLLLVRVVRLESTLAYPFNPNQVCSYPSYCGSFPLSLQWSLGTAGFGLLSKDWRLLILLEIKSIQPLGHRSRGHAQCYWIQMSVNCWVLPSAGVGYGPCADKPSAGVLE